MTSEPTHKMVNGKRIDLTPDEIVDIKADWEIGRLKMEKRAKEQEAKKLKRVELLKRLGLTEEEADLLREKL